MMLTHLSTFGSVTMVRCQKEPAVTPDIVFAGANVPLAPGDSLSEHLLRSDEGPESNHHLSP